MYYLTSAIKVYLLGLSIVYVLAAHEKDADTLSCSSTPQVLGATGRLTCELPEIQDANLFGHWSRLIGGIDKHVYTFSVSDRNNGMVSDKYMHRVEPGFVTLLILNSTYEDSGFYECELSYQNKTVFGNVQYSVLGREEMVCYSSPQYVGVIGALTCKYPEPTVTVRVIIWEKRRNGDRKQIYICNSTGSCKPLVNGTRGVKFSHQLTPGVFTLFIHDTQKEDAGVYECEVTGEQRIMSELVEFTVIGVPTPPTNMDKMDRHTTEGSAPKKKTSTLSSYTKTTQGTDLSPKEFKKAWNQKQRGNRKETLIPKSSQQRALFFGKAALIFLAVAIVPAIGYFIYRSRTQASTQD